MSELLKGEFEFQAILKDSSSLLWLLGGLRSVALVAIVSVREAETSGLLQYSLGHPGSLLLIF